jgi:hypothetical protein
VLNLAKLDANKCLVVTNTKFGRPLGIVDPDSLICVDLTLVYVNLPVAAFKGV